MRHRQVQHIRRLHICGFLEQRNQLRQIEEPGKTCFRTVARSFRGKLDCCDSFAKGCRPIIEVAQSHLLQGIILEIPHNSVQFHHRIADRGSGCKGHALSACQFVQILTLCKHIAGFLGIGLGDTCDVPHFCVEEHIFIEMRLVHKQTVNTQFLKCNYIILSRLVVQLLQLCFQCFLCFFHLLDRETAAILTPGIGQSQCNIVDLTLYNGFLPFWRKRHSFKLRMTNHNGIVIAGCNTGTELFAIAGFKVLFRCHQHIRIGIEPQEVCAPLLCEVVWHHIEVFLR